MKLFKIVVHENTPIGCVFSYRSNEVDILDYVSTYVRTCMT